MNFVACTTTDGYNEFASRLPLPNNIECCMLSAQWMGGQTNTRLFIYSTCLLLITMSAKFQTKKPPPISFISNRMAMVVWEEASIHKPARDEDSGVGLWKGVSELCIGIFNSKLRSISRIKSIKWGIGIILGTFAESRLLLCYVETRTQTHSHNPPSAEPLIHKHKCDQCEKFSFRKKSIGQIWLHY